MKRASISDAAWVAQRTCTPNVVIIQADDEGQIWITARSESHEQQMRLIGWGSELLDAIKAGIISEPLCAKPASRIQIQIEA